MPCLIQDKSGIYYVVSSAKGKRVWRSTGTRKKSDAYRKYADFTKPAGRLVHEKRLSPHIDEFLEHTRANHSARTYKLYKLFLCKLLKFVGDTELEALGPYTFDRYKIERMREVSRSTLNIEIRTFRAFFNCLKRWEIITKSPCEGVKELRIPEALPTYLTIPQLQTLVKQIEDEWLRRIVLFAVMTGARLGEVLNIKWVDVDLPSRTVLIHSCLTFQVKAGKVRMIPLNETALEVISGLPSRDGFVFPGKRGGVANGNFVSGRFRKAVRDAGLNKRLHFHSLRHTFASLLVQRGIPLYQVQKLLGHSSPRVTEVYAHLQNTRMHDVVETISLIELASGLCGHKGSPHHSEKTVVIP